MVTEDLITNKERGRAKLARIPIKIIAALDTLQKPHWIRAKLPTSAKFKQVKELLQKHNLHTVCEEASCPNIGECFTNGTATFMIMGDICTRRCPFCDVAHGKPNPLDTNEPWQLAEAIKILQLKYVVITSVDRDDLLDGGAGHFVACIEKIRQLALAPKIEILVPDFRGRLDKAINILSANPPDVLNHNLETVPRLYKQIRPGADFKHSLKLLSQFKLLQPNVPTKSGIMVGIGETDAEVEDVMQEMRQHNIDRLTIGQYLQPSKYHAPVERYVQPEQFQKWQNLAYTLGFKHVASGAMVRSSYHADAADAKSTYSSNAEATG